MAEIVKYKPSKRSKSYNALERLWRLFQKKQDQYPGLTKDIIMQAMQDGIQNFLTLYLGGTRDFDVYWDKNNTLQIDVFNFVTHPEPFKEYKFNLDELGELKTIQMLKYFEKFLDYADAVNRYAYLRGLRHGLVYGKAYRVLKNGTIVVEVSDGGREFIGYCDKRHLVKEDRDKRSLVLKSSSKNGMLFYLRKVVWEDTDTGVCVVPHFSTNSLTFIESIVLKVLEENNLDKEDYFVKCLARHPFKYSYVILFGEKLPPEIKKLIQHAVNEALRTPLPEELQLTAEEREEREKNRLQYAFSAKYRQEIVKILEYNKKVYKSVERGDLDYEDILRQFKILDNRQRRQEALKRKERKERWERKNGIIK